MNHLEDIQTFVRVVEAGSITKAADQLNTVKSAVSQRLSRLESHLGVQLLMRTTRSQKLTDAGASYYHDCLAIIDAVQEAEGKVKQQHTELAGTINLAVPLSFGLNHLAPAIKKFNDLHPAVVFNIDFNDRQVDLVNEGFDLAFRIGHLKDSNLIARKITTIQMVLCASPEYLKNKGTPTHPNDLKQGHFKLKYHSSADTWHFKDQQQVLAVKVPNVMIANNGDFMRDMAVAGKGLVMIPDFVCYQAIKSGKLVPLLCDYRTDFLTHAYVVYPQNRHLNARIKALIAYLHSYFNGVPYWQVSEPQ